MIFFPISMKCLIFWVKPIINSKPMFPSKNIRYNTTKSAISNLPDFIKCIVDSKDKLIAFSITMPSFTNALKKINGKINLFNFFYLVNALRKNNRASFYLIGIHPEYQNKGITAIIFNEMQKLFNKRKINIVETNPELEENTAIQKLWKNYEHRLHKKRATFTKDL